MTNESENGVKEECLCDAKLADLTRAVELGNGLTEDLRRTVDGFRTDIEGFRADIQLLAQHSQYHTDQVSNIVNQLGAFAASMSQMGPAAVLKMVMGKGKD